MFKIALRTDKKEHLKTISDGNENEKYCSLTNHGS